MGPLTDPDLLAGYNADALGFSGAPEGLFRPRDEAEVVEMVRWCADRRVGLTPVALRSSTTGGCVAPSGYLLSTEFLTGGLDVRPDRRTVVVRPGENLGALKTRLEADGLFLPPDPTSEAECSVGGAVACNASGARSLRYGATRRWVRRLRVVLASGQAIGLTGREVDKNACGYYGFQDPMQFFIGSEGTLGVITEVEFQCLPLPPGFLALYLFFPGEAEALTAARSLRSVSGVRCLEYFDAACLHLLRAHGVAGLPPRAGGMLFLEQEDPDGRPEALVEGWLPRLEAEGALVDDTLVGDTRARQAEMRAWRHLIPATLNERGAAMRRDGGGKVSTDWAVPFDRLAGAVAHGRAACRARGVGEVFCYGHIGNGHPHFNLLAPDSPAATAARAAVAEMCHEACRLGGTVSAEHGVGKVKREYLPLMLAPHELTWMRRFKETLDPVGILAPGNLFPDPTVTPRAPAGG